MAHGTVTSVRVGPVVGASAPAGLNPCSMKQQALRRGGGCTCQQGGAWVGLTAPRKYACMFAPCPACMLCPTWSPMPAQGCTPGARGTRRADPTWLLSSPRAAGKGRRLRRQGRRRTRQRAPAAVLSSWCAVTLHRSQQRPTWCGSSGASRPCRLRINRCTSQRPHIPHATTDSAPAARP